MYFWRKIIIIILGLLFGIGFWGILLILIIDHLLNKIRNLKEQNYFTNDKKRQKHFLKITFQVMGHLAKSKGYVTKADIQLASLLMDNMELKGFSRTEAQRAFVEGKKEDYPLRTKLQEFRYYFLHNSELIQFFLEIQIKTALANNGLLYSNSLQILYVISEELGFSRLQINHILNKIRYYQDFKNYNSSYQETTEPRKSHLTIEEACNVLGVKSSDDNITIKRAYRRMMSEHHPDKLAAKKLSPELMEMAKQKAQEIQATYDFIRREKKFK